MGNKLTSDSENKWLESIYCFQSLIIVVTYEIYKIMSEGL